MNDVSLRARTPQQDVTDHVLRRTAAALPAGSLPGAVTSSTDWAGPVAAHLPDERAVQAACGIMHVHGRASGRPLPLAVDYTATVAGVLAAQGVCAALFARHSGLDIRHVRTSAAQGALFALRQYLAAATAADGPAEPETGPNGADSGAGTPRTATLLSADGSPVELETLNPEAWREFWHRLDVPPSFAGRGWTSFQQRFATGYCDLPRQLREAAAATPLSTLREAADAAGVSLAPLTADPHPGGLPAPWTLTLAPGEDYARPPARGTLPLDGVRVVEATRRVQGPLVGNVLQLLGADVTRIEPPGGDPMRALPPLTAGCSARFLALNAGKPVAEADITTPAGRHTVHELVAGADVFVHNWAPGRAERLELDPQTLWRTRPGLVQAAASGFGDAFSPSRPPIGTDYLAQVHSGLAAALRPAGELPAPSLMTLTDILGGLVCAQGVLTALLVRAHTGQGSRVDSSLLSAASLVPRPATRAHWTPLDLPLGTADGYLYLDEAGRTQPEHVARVVGAPTNSPEATATRFAQHPTAEWEVRLHHGGMTATPVCTDLATLPDNPSFGEAVVPATPDRPAHPHSPWEFA